MTLRCLTVATLAASLLAALYVGLWMAARRPAPDERLREAAYWFRAMVRGGGPDSSDLDLAVVEDLDAALGDWKPEPMIPGLSTVMTWPERKDVSARIPWREPYDPEGLFV